MSNLPDYKNEDLSFEQRAQDLVSRMTLEEKISQMLHDASEIERLDVPSYNWWNEALHGVARAGVATMFPQAIGLASTFDEELIGKMADIISTEGRAKYHEFQRKGDHGIYKGLTFWSPTINIFRDPRWGRGQESYGEDPYLTGRLAVSFIKGIQGDDPKYLKAAACAKHFAAHSGPESERHHFNAVVSEKDMRETYLPAFKECIEEAHVAGVMGAYNMVNGEPCCGSKTLLKDILRDEWGFDGYVTSDCWAIKDFNEGHKVTSCLCESSALAVHNGCDVNCGSAYANLVKGCRDGLITEAEIDRAVVNLMKIRMRLGMFDDPSKVSYTSIQYEEVDSPEHNRFALEVAKKSLVLLKNDNILPLKKEKLKSIAVIGPNADSRDALYGNYFGTASESVTVLQGIREAVGSDTRIFYAEGCHLFKDRVANLAVADDRIAEAVSAAEAADLSIVCLGLDANIEGEEGDISNEFSGGDRQNLDLPGLQYHLLEEVVKTGKPVIVVLLTGSPVSLTFGDEHAKAVVQAWYPGAQGGRAIASMLFGDYSPSGKLPITFYRTTEELPDIHDYSMENRTYKFMQNEALYPFGFGLSYSKFSYSPVKLAAPAIAAGQDMTAETTVKNVGDVAADETVQLYLRDEEASVRVPRWQLAGIRKIHLKPGEEAAVRFTVKARQMVVIDDNGKCILEPGKFTLFVGGSQPDGRSIALTGAPVQKAEFTVTGEPLPMSY